MTVVHDDTHTRDRFLKLSVGFWATVCKTVHPMLSDCCPVCPVCDVGVLWPNGWMDQDETWHIGMPLPRPHCVRWGPSYPQKGHSPQFLAHVHCGQMAGWIKMPLGTEVDHGLGHIVLDRDSARLPPNWHSSPIFLARAYCGQTVAHLSYCWTLVGLGFVFVCLFRFSILYVFLSSVLWHC